MRSLQFIFASLLMCTVVYAAPALAVGDLFYEMDGGGGRDFGGGGGGFGGGDTGGGDTGGGDTGGDTGGGDTGGGDTGGGSPGPAAGSLIMNPVSAGSENIASRANALGDYIANRGGRLGVGAVDVLVNEHGQCRWLDNTDTTREFFVPIGSAGDWQAFIDNAPDETVRATCCPATALTITASDGQFYTYNLPIGRVGSDGPNGRVSVSRGFTLSRSGDGATWTETVSDTLRCLDGGWSSTGITRSGSEPAVPPPPADPGDPDTSGACAASGGTLMPRSVSFTGTARRVVHNTSTQTFASSGSKPYIGAAECATFGITRFSCNPSSSHALSRFDFPGLVKDTAVTVTARYGSYGTFSTGAPKVASFNIANGEVVTGDTTPAVRTFEMTGRMGGPFVMTNSYIMMPAYDTSPNLTSLTVEYNECVPPAGPAIDQLVFASTCSQAGGWGACVSNGSACLTAMQGTSSFIPGTHDGTFCSSVSWSDSGSDGATATFDLRPLLNGRSGDAMIVLPYNIWKGIRDAATARNVMANPQNFTNTPVTPTGVMETAIVFMIPDVTRNASVAKFDKYDSGCGKDCHNMSQYDIQYNGYTKQLTVWIQKGSRWKKQWWGGLSGQSRPWGEQIIWGHGNGKVWSEVRVVSPAPPTCGSAHGLAQHDLMSVRGTLCTTGTGSTPVLTGSTYNWTCSGTDTSVNCAAPYIVYDYERWDLR